MAKIGFARVSTIQQDLKTQIKILEDFGCKKIFASKHSGYSDKNEKALNNLLNYVREDDVVVVTTLDRLARSTKHAVTILEEFKARNIGFIALNQNIDTTKRNDPFSQAMIQFIAILAELERVYIVERTQGGKQAKIEAGDLSAIGGRPRKVTDKVKQKIFEDFAHGLSISKTAAKHNLSTATIARVKREYNQQAIAHDNIE